MQVILQEEVSKSHGADDMQKLLNQASIRTSDAMLARIEKDKKTDRNKKQIINFETSLF